MVLCIFLSYVIYSIENKLKNFFLNMFFCLLESQVKQFSLSFHAQKIFLLSCRDELLNSRCP